MALISERVYKSEDCKVRRRRMTIEGALANLESFKGILDPATQQRLIDSIGLGIEALQRERERRFNPRIQSRVLLPGETT